VVQQRLKVVPRALPGYGQKDKYKSLDELKGKNLAARHWKTSFIGKIVLPGNTTRQFLCPKISNQHPCVTRFGQRELDAVILNEQQFGGLASLQMKIPLEAIFTSEEIPLMGVVANSATTTAEERARFSKAGGDVYRREGKKLCDCSEWNPLSPSTRCIRAYG